MFRKKDYELVSERTPGTLESPGCQKDSYSSPQSGNSTPVADRLEQGDDFTSG